MDHSALPVGVEKAAGKSKEMYCAEKSKCQGFPPQPEDVTIVAPIFCFHMPTSHIYLKEICQSQQQKGKERNCFHPFEHRKTKPTCQRRSRTGRNEDRTGGKRGRGGIIYPATFWQKVKDDTWTTERSNEGEWTKAWKEETNKYSLCLVPWCILGSDI